MSETQARFYDAELANVTGRLFDALSEIERRGADIVVKARLLTAQAKEISQLREALRKIAYREADGSPGPTLTECVIIARAALAMSPSNPQTPND